MRKRRRLQQAGYDGGVADYWAGNELWIEKGLKDGEGQMSCLHCVILFYAATFALPRAQLDLVSFNPN